MFILVQLQTISFIESLLEPWAQKKPNDDILNRTQEYLINKFGDLLNQSWAIKKNLTDVISSTEIDNYYQEALDSGAIGGKLLGAGG